MRKAVALVMILLLLCGCVGANAAADRDRRLLPITAAGRSLQTAAGPAGGLLCKKTVFHLSIVSAAGKSRNAAHHAR